MEGKYAVKLSITELIKISRKWRKRYNGRLWKMQMWSDSIWNDMNIPLSSKIRLVRSLVMSIFLYACGSWTLTADTERRIQAMEMRCLRKLLGITYRDHISNEEVRSHWAPRRTLDHSKATQTEMVRASNKMYRACQDNPAGHSARREKKRQTKKRWEDNIPELTGMTLGAAMRKPERREEWRELVARSSVAPNGPPDYGIGEGEEVQHGSFTVNALRWFIRYWWSLFHLISWYFVVMLFSKSSHNYLAVFRFVYLCYIVAYTIFLVRYNILFLLVVTGVAFVL